MANCGATTSDGTPCEQPAGWGTDHPGEGRCRFHGGASPIDHGLYSKCASRRLGNKFDQMRQAAEEASNLTDEIALARAAVATLVDSDAKLTDDRAETLMSLLDRLSRIAARHDKIQHGEHHVVTHDTVGQFVSVVKGTIRETFEGCADAEELIGAIGRRLEGEVDPA